MHPVNNTLLFHRNVTSHNIGAASIVASHLMSQGCHTPRQLSHYDLNTTLTRAVTFMSYHRDAHVLFTEIFIEHLTQGILDPALGIPT